MCDITTMMEIIESIIWKAIIWKAIIMSINLKSARAKFREVEKNHAVDSDQWNQAVIEYHTEIAQVMLTDESWLDNKDFLVEVSEAIYRDLGEDYGFKTEKLVEARESIPVFNTPLVSKGGAFWCNDTAWLDGLLIPVSYTHLTLPTKA